MSKKPPKYKRKPSEKSRDRLRISALYQQGLLQDEIAEEIGVSQPTVSRTIKDLEGDWLQKSNASIELKKASEEAYLLNKRRDLERAWLASIRTNIIKTKKAVMVQGVITQQEISEREEIELGDIKYMNALIDIAKQLATLYGIEAPKRSEVTGKDGEPLVDENSVYNRVVEKVSARLEGSQSARTKKDTG